MFQKRSALKLEDRIILHSMDIIPRRLLRNLFPILALGFIPVIKFFIEVLSLHIYQLPFVAFQKTMLCIIYSILYQRAIKIIPDYIDMVCHKCYTYSERSYIMPTKYPRVNLVVEPPIHSAIQNIARLEGISMSAVARELIKEAILLREDAALACFAEKREKTFRHKKSLTHEQTWR
jgi:hypothetical protein